MTLRGWAGIALGLAVMVGEGRPSTPLVPSQEGKAWILGLRGG